MTSISLKRTAAIFRLKRNDQNITSTESSENLISYQNIERMHGIIHVIAGRTDVVETVVDKENDTEEGQTYTKCMLGEHVIAYWLERHIARWYLVIVEAEKSDKLLISYKIRADSKGKS